MARAVLCSLCVLVVIMMIATPALAHGGGAVTGGFLAGVAHPLFGPDHIAAMVAVGLWSALLGPPAIWLLPVIFPLVMAFGGVLGILGLALPDTERAIAGSAIVLGVMVLGALRSPLWLAAAIVGFFAIFHGNAHGRELPADVDAVTYCLGLVIATGLLHLAGIAFGLLARWPAGRIAVRAAGGVITLAGAAFLLGAA
jgi:urease accessory protein